MPTQNIFSDFKIQTVRKKVFFSKFSYSQNYDPLIVDVSFNFFSSLNSFVLDKNVKRFVELWQSFSFRWGEQNIISKYWIFHSKKYDYHHNIKYTIQLENTTNFTTWKYFIQSKCGENYNDSIRKLFTRDKKSQRPN